MRMTSAPLGHIGRLVAIAALGLQFALPAAAAPLDADIQRKVREATFEVVIPKPEKESITYDKPWQELIPYQLRSDKYIPIGTAFSIGSSRYVTAMHVLAAAFGDSRGEPMLRDGSGKLYPLGTIVKGSLDQDFIVFTLAKPPEQTTALGLEEKPELNGTVYAVGNALGEGIVVREGNYVSDTPEDESGRWKWLRFSAPISGGNSGGPLVDAKGNVIGVVRAKRTTENTLNFAVPIELVTKAPDKLATQDARAVTGFFVFDKTKTDRFKADIALPKSFADFSAAYLKALDDFNTAQLRALLAENADEIFPRGTSSERLLHGLYERAAPAVVVKDSNGQWAISTLNFTRLDLGHEGWQDSAVFKGVTVYHRRKPDDIDLATWYAEPQVAKDLVFKASPSTIHVGGENAKIVSMGKPEDDTPFTDTWGRVWRLRIWHTTTVFTSGWLAEFDLPVPDGTVGFSSGLSAVSRSATLDRMKLLTGFIATSYYGKLGQWDQFLAQKAYLPKQLARPVLKIAYGRSFTFDDGRMAFAFGPELNNIERDSRLRLDFGFVPGAGDRDGLDIGGVATYHSDGKTETGVYRRTAPAGSAPEAAQNDWGKRVRHEHPYDAVALTANDKQSISAIYGTVSAQPVPEVLYTFIYRAENGTAQDVMKAKLDLLMREAKVNEH